VAYIADIASIREEGNLPDSTVLPDAKLTPHLVSASIELSRLITSTVYTATIALAGTAQQKIDLKKAEALLALSYAIIPLNIETSGTGIVRSKGFDASRSELLSQSEAQALAEEFRERAMKLVSPYFPEPEDEEDGDAGILNVGKALLTVI
jgi:hypothetical protein